MKIVTYRFKLSKKATFFSVFALCLIFNLSVKGQDFENFLAAGKEDGSRYIGNYMEPVYKGLISNLNNGWYHSGKTHKKWGFDITINASASFVPEEDKTFVFNNSDYNYLELQSGSSSANMPTVMGATSTERIVVNNRDVNGNIIPNEFLPAFETLDGIEDELPTEAAVPSPMVQAGLGLPGKTDLKVRFVPNVGNDEIDFNLVGVGLQHNLMQYFIKPEKVPVFDLSVLAAFTSSTTVYTPDDNQYGTNQETTIKINAYTAQLIGNLDFKVINFYGGIGYASGDADTKVKGTYTYNIVDASGNPIGGSLTVEDPIDISYKVDSQIKATLGMRLNIAWFKIFADYSIQEYNALNAGVAFSFR